MHNWDKGTGEDVTPVGGFQGQFFHEKALFAIAKIAPE